MSAYIIEGGHPLDGSVRIHGAKNSVLPILAACLLAPGECVIHNCPELSDVAASLDILRHLGCRAERQGDAVVVDASAPTGWDVPDAQSAVENPAISETPTTAKGDLVIEITKNSSWISVKDQNRKVLAQKEYKQGETLTFNGDEYALIIGAPGNVRITYKGEVYPLTVDGRVAKFKLPKP